MPRSECVPRQRQDGGLAFRPQSVLPAPRPASRTKLPASVNLVSTKQLSIFSRSWAPQPIHADFRQGLPYRGPKSNGEVAYPGAPGEEMGCVFEESLGADGVLANHILAREVIQVKGSRFPGTRRRHETKSMPSARNSAYHGFRDFP